MKGLRLPLAHYSAKVFWMKLPKDLLDSLEGVDGFDREAFIKVHEKGEPVTSIRLNPARQTGGENPLAFLPFQAESPGTVPLAASRIPWSQYGYYLTQRPSFTFDPLFHAGCYYVQEASSMFLEQALKQLVDLSQPLKVLDLSAAPGGKSTHIQSLLSPESLLVSNEVIRSRCAVLADNMIKWGSHNVIVTQNDPSDFKKLTGYFDVIVVDAPCSGSGLFRKDAEAIGEWSLNNVSLCSQRQQRILADVLPALKQHGLLVYSTCSYSREEDESIGDWLEEVFDMKNETLRLDPDWGIVSSVAAKSTATGYRFYPDRLKGEGFFLSCFRKTRPEKEARPRPPRIELASAKEKVLLRPWLIPGELEWVREGGQFSVLPSRFLEATAFLKTILNLQYKGTRMGQIMKDRLVPDHALALSTLITSEVPDTALSFEEAIRYLQRQEIKPSTTQMGWQTVSYLRHRLGWINVLPNRVNNYYPKEMRILKQELPAFKK